MDDSIEVLNPYFYFSTNLKGRLDIGFYRHEKRLRERKRNEYRDIVLPSGRFALYLEENLLAETHFVKGKDVFVCDYYYLYYGPLLELGILVQVRIDHSEAHQFVFYQCFSDRTEEMVAMSTGLGPMKKWGNLLKKEYEKINEPHQFLLGQIAKIAKPSFYSGEPELDPQRN